MPLGLSPGELALIALAGAVAFARKDEPKDPQLAAVLCCHVAGPKDVPVIARTAGRLAGRAVGHLRSFRTTMGSFAERAQIAQVHLELQQAMAQLEAIRHELRSGVSLSPSGPFTRSAAIKEGRLAEDEKQNVLKEQQLGLRHHQLSSLERDSLLKRDGDDNVFAVHSTSIQSRSTGGGTFPPTYREAFSSNRGNGGAMDSTNYEYGMKTMELTNASLGLRSPLLPKEVSEWSANLQSTDSEMTSTRAFGQGLPESFNCFGEGNGPPVGELGRVGESIQSGDVNNAELQNSLDAGGGDNTEEDYFKKNLLPISAVSAGLISKRAGGTTLGSDILMDSLIEEEVASHAAHFLKDHSSRNS